MKLSLRNGVPDRPARRPRRRPLRPCVDGLERRELKDGGIALVGRTLDIEGATTQNLVVVSYADSSHSVVSVTLNAATLTFNRADVSRLHFDGLGAFNAFYNLTDIDSTALGGDGTNVFYGGTGDDSFSGGSGVNVFYGNGGTDSLTGGDGTNLFFNVNARDTITVGHCFNYIA